MNKLEKAKQIIRENLYDAKYGIFDSRNILGDPMTNIYNENGLIIDVCYPYAYIKCEHCKHWIQGQWLCDLTNEHKRYYNRCKQFEWVESEKV